MSAPWIVRIHWRGLLLALMLLLGGCATYPSAWYEITDEINRTPRERAESNLECMRIAEARSTAPAGFSIVTTTVVRPGIGVGVAQPVMATNYELYEMVWVSCMAGRRYQLQKIHDGVTGPPKLR
jgi:hypothetical protein